MLFSVPTLTPDQKRRANLRSRKSYTRQLCKHRRSAKRCPLCSASQKETIYLVRPKTPERELLDV